MAGWKGALSRDVCAAQGLAALAGTRVGVLAKCATGKGADRGLVICWLSTRKSQGWRPANHLAVSIRRSARAPAGRQTRRARRDR